MIRIIAAALLLMFPILQSPSVRAWQTPSVTGKTDRDYDRLIGPVRLVRTERQSMSGAKKGQPTRELDEIVIYDEGGWLAQTFTFGINNCATSRRTVKYENAGSRTESVFWGKHIVEGQDAATQERVPSVTFKQTFKFDSSGNRSEVDDYDPTGKLYRRTVYKFDDKGRVIEEALGDADSIGSRTSFSYDPAGMVAEVVWHHSLGGIDQTHVSNFKYETDSRGNWVKRLGTSATSIKGKMERGEPWTDNRLIEYYESTDPGRSDASSARSRTTAGVDLTPCESFAIRKSGGVFQQNATKKIQPPYPQVALDKRISGKVVVELTLDETGKVVSLRSIEGAPELRLSAEEAARGWEFRPTYLMKVPVRTIGTITFNFSL
jgi:TonB family protein